MAAAEAAIDVRGVEQRDAEIERLVHDPARGFEIDASAEIVAAQSDDGDLQSRASEPALLHDGSSLSVKAWRTACASRSGWIGLKITFAKLSPSASTMSR